MTKIRKRPIYENMLMVDANNNPIFRCDSKKLNWYIDNNLAVKISATVGKLLIKPRKVGDLTLRHNKCAVCGYDDALNLTEHHLVPRSYRKCFPKEYKENRYSDIVPLCVDCHRLYECKYSAELRNHLANIYDAPVNGLILSSNEKKVYVYANTLLKYADRIPEPRISKLKDIVSKYYGKVPNKSDLEYIMRNLEYKVCNSKSHSAIVVSKLNNINDFIEMWINHFIETMNPKHLPEDIKYKNYL